MKRILLRIEIYFVKISYENIVFGLLMEGRRESEIMGFTEYLLGWYRKKK